MPSPDQNDIAAGETAPTEAEIGMPPVAPVQQVAPVPTGVPSGAEAGVGSDAGTVGEDAGDDTGEASGVDPDTGLPNTAGAV